MPILDRNKPLVVDGDPRYAFATGVVRGKWVKRMDRTALNRLIEAKPSELGKLLSEQGYAGAEKDAEKALLDSWLDTLKLVDSLSQNPEITSLLRLFNDFTNGATAVKAEFFKLDYEPLHLPGGTAKPEELKRVAAGETHIDTVPKEVRQAMSVATSLYQSSKSPLSIDIAIDSYFATIFVDRLLESNREFLREFARRWADTKNIAAYLRLRLAKMPIEYFNRFFIDGGHIWSSEFKRFEDIELDGLPARMTYSVYGKPLADSVSALIKDETFQPLANFCDNMLENFLRQNVYISFGLEVLLAYGFLKWSELRAIGAIIRMKMARIDEEKITERVRYGDI